MKKMLFLMLLSVLLFTIQHPADAQKLSKKFSVGFGLEGGLPTGDMKDFYNFTGGLSLRFSYHAGPGFATLTSGAMPFIPKSLNGKDTKAGLLIPIKAGYKYIIGEHFFIMGELGYGSFTQFFPDDSDKLQSIKSNGFLYAPAIGAQMGAAELSLRYESLRLPGGRLSFMGLRIGFNF